MEIESLEDTNCQSFCGCMEYQQTFPVDTKVYISFFLILLVIMASLKTGIEWFIYKDYYPLKERSPLLCIIMIAFLALEILLYPILFIYNYFTQSFDQGEYLYRMFYYGLDGTVYSIYVLRSIRLVYAHTTDPSRQKTYIFKMFKHEYYLGILAVSLMVLRMLPILFNPCEQQCLFYTMIEFSTPFSRDDEVPFISKNVTVQFVWLLILMYCLKIQTKTHPKYSMKKQLILVISVNMLLNIVDLIMISGEVGSSSLFFGLCTKFQFYPTIEVTKSVSLIILFSYSIVYPLMKKKVYHMLLPTGRNYGLTKTMRDFLLEPEFLEIFTKFLEHLDSAEGTGKYSLILEKWKKVMILKFCNKREEQKLAEIKMLLMEGDNPSSVLEDPRRNNNNSIVRSLIKSIENLEEPLNLSEEVMSRYRSEVNEKVEELEKKLLQKLDNIYKHYYHETKSYYHLKTRLNFYKKVNVNMILMKMALMMESDDLL